MLTGLRASSLPILGLSWFVQFAFANSELQDILLNKIMI